MTVFKSVYVNTMGWWHAREKRLSKEGSGEGVERSRRASSHGSGALVGEVWIWW